MVACLPMATHQMIDRTNERTNLIFIPEHHVLTDGPAYGLPVTDHELEPRHLLPENLGEALGWEGDGAASERKRTKGHVSLAGELLWWLATTPAGGGHPALQRKPIDVPGRRGRRPLAWRQTTPAVPSPSTSRNLRCACRSDTPASSRACNPTGSPVSDSCR